ncbi:cilia- and flagella-associated protein 47-like isoform X3 [Coregonus clupeaformis]|uniref:cilia- and flagella-associated protein 47-like isoform X3 n=1 Tax=Coregonus clupeaformis TaxID=59861 RepID=UPI001E1C6FE1|nr:cilia- and flagella-associated protein 47-like isoform X3 [Coregonus clupeaformis]
MATNSIRINPPVVEFTDVKAGKVYKTTVTVTNTGSTSKRMRLLEPTSKLFTFRVTNTETPIAAGLALSGTLEFRPEKDEDVCDRLLLVLDDIAMEIPLFVFSPACSLTMESLADFGSVTANSQVISKEVELTNQGSAPGAFQVLYDGDQSIRLSPRSGVLQPGATQWLKVELCTDKPTRVREEAQVKLQNSKDVVLKIRADVLEQSLELQDLEGERLSCLRFGPVFFGTSRVEKVVLVNNGPQACDWMVVLQDDASGTEVGFDLQRSTDAALLERSVRNRATPVDPSTVITCVPNEGGLRPYEKTTLWVCFRPVSRRRSREEQKSSGVSAAASKQDYSLFLKFEMVGSKDGFNHQQHSTVLPHNGCCVELAVTGSALPVSLVPSPGHSFSFQQCMMGERVDVLCVLHNLSPILPVTFKFRKMANFISDPPSGTISPGQNQDVVLSFAPHQMGTFKVKQVLEVLGQVVHLEPSSTKLRLRSFHTITLHLSAVCRAQTACKTPKLNPGITPAVTNETGQYARVPSSELGRCVGLVRAAVLSAAKTRLHSHGQSKSHRRSQRLDGSQRELVAFPNDRACSIRPASPDTTYRTIFTGVERYRYVDPDFAFTEEEQQQRQRHRDHYLAFFRSLRNTRLQKTTARLHGEVEDVIDIGLRPAAGLLTPKLSLRDLESNHSQEGRSVDQGHSQLLTTCMLAAMETRSSSRQVTEGINALTSTNQEVADCSRTLTAQQLHQVVIGPSSIDFGEVCVASVCVRTLDLVNNLQVYVWVQLELDCCPELQRSSPLSHVLPPLSRATLPLVLESTKLGKFHKSISYTVNNCHRGHVLVQSQVVPVVLQLSQSQVVLSPSPSYLAPSGYRGTVTLVNPRNHPADFTWRPIITEKGIAFSIRPATGTVEAYRELDCEVMWHPSFYSPVEGQFDLCVHQGNTAHLRCVTKLGSSTVKLSEKHLVFRSVPLNFPSVRTATLYNTGHNHAYFQVLDVYPLPGMVVTPPEGVVPVGGQAEVQVHLNPGAVMKFDTRVEIVLRNMKSLELRVGGSVEPPLVDINVKSFLFHGVHSGSSRGVPFSLRNRSSALARVQFDLSEHTDFTIHFPPHSAGTSQEPDVFAMDLQGQQTAECCLVFSPKQVAAYDFNLPVTVNSVGLPSSSSSSSSPAPPSSVPKSSSSRAQHIVTPRPLPVAMETLSRRVQATALRAPLEMSPSSLPFDLEPLSSLTTSSQTQTVELRNVSEKRVSWRIDCSAAVTPGGGSGTCTSSSEGMFTICPTTGTLEPQQCVSVTVSLSPERVTPVTAGQIQVSLPLFLSEEGEEERDREKGEEGGVPHPYRVLSLSAIPHPPSISFLPPRVLLTPVPLDTPSTTTFSLLPTGYPSGSCLRVEVEEMVLEDGSRLKALSVSLPHNGTVPPQPQTHTEPQTHTKPQTHITCTVTFCSPQPLDLTSHITFLDHLNNRFQVEVCATADNSLLTVWPYLSLHRSEQQIVLKSGRLSGFSGESGRSQMTREAVLQPCYSPSPLSRYTSSSSTFAFLSSTSNHSISDSVGDRRSRSVSAGPGPRGKEDWPQKERERGGEGGVGLTDQQQWQQQGIPVFPGQDSEEGLYYHSILQAVQKWFSQFGWPRGPNPISLPHSLRRVVCKVQTVDSSSSEWRNSYLMSHGKDTRTVYDMLRHLSGQTLPGVSTSQSLSCNLTERVQQLLHQNTVLLAFLRRQGACLSHIRPEYLLDSQEFSHWSSLQAQSQCDQTGMVYSSMAFESLSKRAWMDVLLQTYKVLVLPRVTEGPLSLGLQSCDSGSMEQQVPRINPKPLASNVYSTWERRLLTWLNLHYHTMRTTVWSPLTCRGDVPSARWVVNFDLDLADGLVLAAVLAAYCPFLISSHLQRMYTSSSRLEQNLHNGIILSQAFTLLCLDIDIQPTELSDPNPVLMLMLCVYLYERLPQYLPRRTITLSGSLHHIFTKQVCLKSPSSRPMWYHASIVGKEAYHFSLPQGASITIPPKGRGVEVTVQYSCSFLRPMEAVLLLTSRSASSASPSGATLAFSLKTQVTHITPSGILKCKSPCYQLKELQLKVKNPFSKDAKFRVVLVESKANLLQVEKSQESQENLIQQVFSRTNHSSDNNTSLSTDRLNGGSDCVEWEDSDLHSDPADECGVKEFFSPVRSMCLASGQTDTIELHYLPFHLGKRHCSVLLVSQQVGELVYLVKGTADLPLPSPLTTKPSPNVVHVNTITSGGADPRPVVNLRCGVGSTLDEVVCVPLVNGLWERALATVGQQRMSPVEKQRRSLTDTLDSSSVRAGVAATALTASQALLVHGPGQSQVVEYSVEVSLPEHFLLPHTITLPVARDARVTQDNLTDSEVVMVPLRFHAHVAGRFRCQLVLQSWRDIRVHLLEAVVTAEGGHAQLEFTTPAHLSVTQDIPLINESSQDWRLQGVVSGCGFYGPPVVYIRAGEKVCYPLTFRPITQSIVTGRLSLLNDTDGTEHSFTLRGVGERSLPLDHVVLHCPVRQVTHSTLLVPNYSQHPLTCKVVSDLSIVSGPPTLDIKPGHTVPYTVSVSPWKRGKHTGSMSFLAVESETGAENESRQYEVWFSIEVICDPAPPLKVLAVHCAVQSSVAVEIPLSNPEAEPLELGVCLEGEDLSGDTRVCVPPRSSLTYTVTFSPAIVGKRTGSVVFQSELVGEFWYQLDLLAQPPVLTTLPQSSCELGKWTRLYIPLVNPTDETLELDTVNSNPRNFTLELDTSRPLIVAQHSSTQVPVRFSPSTIGAGNHTAKISFTCSQLKQWSFQLCGEGLTPGRMEPLSVASPVGSHSSLILPFRNPTEHPALLHLRLTDEEPGQKRSSQSFICDRTVFCIPLKQTQGVRVSAGASVDIPVVFAPDSMQLHQAWLQVQLEPLFNHPRLDTPLTTAQRDKCVVVEGGRVRLVRWIYPIHGIPEAPPKPSHPAVIECEARGRVEERVEVLLTGCVPGSSVSNTDTPLSIAPSSVSNTDTPLSIAPSSVSNTDTPLSIAPSSVSNTDTPLSIAPSSVSNTDTPLSIAPSSVSNTDTPLSIAPSSVSNTDTPLSIAPSSGTSAAGFRLALEDFLCEVCYNSDAERSQLEGCVALSLLNCHRDPHSGIVSLTVNLIFTPYKPLRCSAVLAVQCVTGGLWKFPISLISTEPQVDDVITINAAGLHKTSAVGFRLTSQTRYPEPFTAGFLPGGGSEFQVCPSSGELLPVGSAGTLLTVSFTASMYSKRHHATLLVQTADMQWTYEVKGTTPAYTPPSSASSNGNTSSRELPPTDVRQRNFVSRNLQLPAMANSSPIKHKASASQIR